VNMRNTISSMRNKRRYMLLMVRRYRLLHRRSMPSRSARVRHVRSCVCCR
jgi:hypothetical protein